MLRVCKSNKNSIFSDKIAESMCAKNFCSLWANYRKSSIRHFIVSYNNAYRILHNLPMRCNASFSLPMLSLTILLYYAC